uniref:Uncharacterized protein n=1 Tax=Romanomermis culicivorax TaxID=13658 RepID=A0A915KWF5_ROMCU
MPSDDSWPLKRGAQRNGFFFDAAVVARTLSGVVVFTPTFPIGVVLRKKNYPISLLDVLVLTSGDCALFFVEKSNAECSIYNYIWGPNGHFISACAGHSLAEVVGQQARVICFEDVYLESFVYHFLFITML